MYSRWTGYCYNDGLEIGKRLLLKKVEKFCYLGDVLNVIQQWRHRIRCARKRFVIYLSILAYNNWKMVFVSWYNDGGGCNYKRDVSGRLFGTVSRIWLTCPESLLIWTLMLAIILPNCVFLDTDLSEFPVPNDILESPSLGDIRHQEDFKFLIQATVEHLGRQSASNMLCSWTLWIAFYIIPINRTLLIAHYCCTIVLLCAVITTFWYLL